MKRFSVLLLMVFFSSFFLAAFEKFWPSLTITSKKDTEKLFKNYFVVEDAVAINAKKWIRTKHDIEIAYPIQKKDMATVLLDFESYPKFMPYLDEITILERTDNTVTARHKNVIWILGYAYITVYTMKYEWEIVDGNLAMEWSFISSDGTLLESGGGCSIDSVFVDGVEYTRIRHRNNSLVRKDFPAQEAIMRLVGTSEVENIVKAVYKECKKRSAGK
ncbi:MAG TPA: SRPBCC family protein [Spirochaetia bacterium]|nr:SRPBCC family protein [Spirochaetia bacterium]